MQGRTRLRAGRFAGRLTLAPQVRRVFVAVLAVALHGAPAWSAAPSAADAAALQPVADIVAAAERFVGRSVDTSGLVPRAGHLDPRLSLPRCDRPLEGYLPPGGRIGARTLVGVRCAGSRPWKVYVPVDVLEPRTVLVARRTLAPGRALTAEDLVAEERDVSRLAGGYVDDIDELLGRRLERRVAAGTVIAPNMLEETVLVRRGQSVTLLVQAGSLVIRTAGLALADGTRDERIRVRNVTSDRIVEGVVRSAQEVEVLVR